MESAARCLDEAEEFADNCYEYRRIAGVWKNLLSDRDRGARCLGEAEGMATRFKEWQAIADLWKRDFEDMDGYYRCLDEAGGQIDDLYSVEFSDFTEYAFADLVARDEAAVMDLASCRHLRCTASGPGKAIAFRTAGKGVPPDITALH